MLEIAGVYDTPGAISSCLKSAFNQNDAGIIVLYEVYSWPNVILTLIGGYIVDHLGLLRMTLVFSGLVTLGQPLLGVGVQISSYNVEVIGRTIYGLGGETLKVAQNTLTVRWAPPHISLLFGLVTALGRIAGTLNFAITPTLASQSITLAAWVGTGIVIASLVIGILIILVGERN